MKKKIALLFATVSVFFISCDQDFNTIGADLVGNEHFDFDTYEVQGLKAYSVRTGEVQTNNLPINPLGFYDNPYFGETKANFVTQVALGTERPTFGTNVQVENVTLYVPYFSTVKTTNNDGSREYTLDSIYSKNETGKISKMRLNVYENGYFLSSFGGANQDEMAKYYSDMGNLIENQKRGHDGAGNSTANGTRLNDSPNTAENDQFFFNNAEIVIYKQKFNTTLGILQFVDVNDVPLADQSDSPSAIALRVVKERLSPGIYLTLNKAFFKKTILEASSTNLFNNNNFKQYFKGLYFKMEQLPGQQGAMAMLNFNNAKLNINYSSIDAGATTATSKTLLLSLGTNASSNTVSLQDYTYAGDYNTGLSNPANDFTNSSSPIFGQNERLYIKGGKGSVVYMDVFGDTDVKQIINGVFVPGANQVPDELEELRLKGWLINDAYLEFYVDKSKMIGNSKYQEAERLYLFDATNQKVLVDYAFDASTSSNSKRNKLIFDGIVQRDETADRKAVKYKIRISQHINNLINSSNVNINKNVRLGLCITENISITGNFYYKNPLDISNTPSNTEDDIKFFPASSIIAQQGVVLYGTNPSLPSEADKKLKLTIHFTKPN